MIFKKIYNSIYSIGLIIFIVLWYTIYWKNDANYILINIANLTLLLICLILSISQIIYTVSNKKFILMYFLLFLSIFFFIFNKHANFVMLILLAYAGRMIEDKKILRIYFFTSLFMFALTIVFCNLGRIDEVIIPRYLDGHIVGIRYGLGLGHPNKAAIKWFSIIASYYCIKTKKNNIIEFIILSIITYFIYSFTDSRTGFIISELFLIIMIKDSILNIFKIKLVKNLAIYSFGILTTITLILPVFGEYSNPINQKLSMRPMIYKYYLSNENFGISFLGKYISDEWIKSLPMDNSYLFLLIENGIVIFSLYAIIITMSAKKLYKENNFICLIVLCFFVIYGLFENTLFDYSVNFALLIGAKKIFQLNSSKNII